MKQRQVLRNDTLDLIRHEDLIAVELYLVLLYLEVVAYLREVENTGQIERVVDIHVYVEEWILAKRVELVVEILVLLLRYVGRLARPQRIDIVDDIVLVRVDILAVLPLLHLAEGNGHRQEAAILLKQLLDLRCLAVFAAIIRNVKHDGRTTVMVHPRPLPSSTRASRRNSNVHIYPPPCMSG